MRIVQMTLDEALIVEVDKLVKELGTTRSAFTREALKLAIEKIRRKQLECKHREGYMSKPVSPDEFDGFEDEQVWSNNEKG